MAWVREYRYRAIGERDQPELQAITNATVTRMVDALRWQVPRVFFGLTDEQQACMHPLATSSCVSSANITRDYQSPIHTDDNDVCEPEHPFMSGLAWYACGTLISSCTPMICNSKIVRLTSPW